MDANKIKKLMDMKKKVDMAQEQFNKDKGALSEVEKILNKEYNCKNIEEAENMIKEKEKELSLLNKEIEQEIEKLENSFDFDREL